MNNIHKLVMVFVAISPQLAVANDPAGYAAAGAWFFLIVPAFLLNILAVPLTFTRKESRLARGVVITIVALCLLVNVLSFIVFLNYIAFTRFASSFLIGMLINTLGTAWVVRNVVKLRRMVVVQG